MSPIKKIFIFIASFVIIAVLFVNRAQIENLYSRFSNKLPEVKKLEEKVPEVIKKQVNAPLPLRAKEESPQSFLTVQGVINFTNSQREANGLSPLSQNSLLNNSAVVKAHDMFEKQYFAHDSPQGLEVDDLTASSGYEFILIGENLALGNFLNDQVLVQAWMDSPGHRENILNGAYREIGVGVVKGTYQGKTTWMAVQHFGLSLSACPQPDDVLAQKIEDNRKTLNQMQIELEAKSQELENTRQKRGPDYNQKVEEYNSLVEEYNNLAEKTKSLIESYNNQIQTFNQCAS